ncbi:MAG: hypothetical protein CMJ64_24610 [Planctomycetaceae bacterium]|nr:hypothetical protein [Planctomycetaceae bacterium]
MVVEAAQHIDVSLSGALGTRLTHGIQSEDGTGYHQTASREQHSPQPASCGKRRLKNPGDCQSNC